MQLLGMGHNGHIGFNEPDEEFKAATHRVYLAEQTIKANARFFDSPEQVPTSAITMGIKTIMSAKKVVVVASGSDKTNILKKALYGPITPRVPASILQLHGDLTIVTDCLG
jgi:glucosamine-6-phosphate deaminase